MLIHYWSGVLIYVNFLRISVLYYSS